MTTTSALKKMDGVAASMPKTIDLSPISRDVQHTALLDTVTEMFKHQFTLVNAGMGSGKSRNMVGMFAEESKNLGKLMICFTHAFSEETANHLEDEYAELPEVTVIRLNRGDTFLVTIGKISKALKQGHSVVLLFHCNVHVDGRFTKTAELVINLLIACKHGARLLYQIDEVDAQLTTLTGGINGSTQRDLSTMKSYAAVVRQRHSLNMFDILRSVDATCIGWTGTGVYMVCSKLASMGYAWHNILIVNVYPIEEIYPRRQAKTFTLEDSDDMVRKMESERLTSGGSILGVFSSQKAILACALVYKRLFGVDMPYVDMTYKSRKTQTQLKHELNTKPYVFGIKRIATGFNLASYTGKHFAAAFLCRKFADRGSQPISSNPDHPLASVYSACFKQASARGRDNECTLYVLDEYKGYSLYEELLKGARSMDDAVAEAVKYGPVGSTQQERMHHTVYEAICVNIRDSQNRKTICKILDDVSADGRRLEEEIKLPTCDHLYWRNRVAQVWLNDAATKYQLQVQLEEPEEGTHVIGVSSSHHTSPSSSGGGSGASSGGSGTSSGGGAGSSSGGGSGASSGGGSGGGSGSGTSSGSDSGASPSNPSQFTSGSGQRDGRVLYEEEYMLVKARACGNCAACSDTAAEPQVAHVYEHAAGGSPTADNMVLMCRGCHGMYDEPALSIHPRMTGYWCKRKFCAFPDRQQFAGVTMANLETRLRYDLCKHGKNPSGDIIAYAEAIMPSIGYVFHPFPA